MVLITAVACGSATKVTDAREPCPTAFNGGIDLNYKVDSTASATEAAPILDERLYLLGARCYEVKAVNGAVTVRLWGDDTARGAAMPLDNASLVIGAEATVPGAPARLDAPPDDPASFAREHGAPDGVMLAWVVDDRVLRARWVDTRDAITGADLAAVSADFNPEFFRWNVNLKLRDDRHAALEALSKRLIDKPMLIVADHRVLLAPIVMDTIRGGRIFVDMGTHSAEAEAKHLAASLLKPLPRLTLATQSTAPAP